MLASEKDSLLRSYKLLEDLCHDRPIGSMRIRRLAENQQHEGPCLVAKL